MLYNIYIENDLRHLTLLGLTKDKVQRVIHKYKEGENEIFIDSEKHYLGKISKIKIFTIENNDIKSGKQLFEICKTHNKLVSNYFGGIYIPESILEKFGDDKTEEFINDDELEKLKESQDTSKYVNPKRIKELKELKSKKIDFSRLIAILKEINICSKNNLKFAIPPLVRSVIDQVPPIFGKQNFSEISGNYGTRSFRESMKILDDASRKIADSYLHTHIRISESSLPNETQIDFKNSLDVLLQEIVNIIKKEV